MTQTKLGAYHGTQPTTADVENNPSVFAGIQFEDITTHDELIKWSKAYSEHAIETYDMRIDLELTTWEVSTKAKRYAGKVQSLELPGATRGVPIDWDATRENISETPRLKIEYANAPFDDIRAVNVRLSWGAADAYDCAEWKRVLRHELIHVEDHQRYGATNHSAGFKARANELDTDMRCEKYSDAKYHLHCTECGEFVAGRYKKSKTVKQPEKYRSKCCGAPLSVEDGPAL